MQVSIKKRISIWLMWFLLVPAIFMIVYAAFPPQMTGKEIDMIAFLVLMCIVACIPIEINKVPLVIFEGVSLAVFLIFGLTTELALTQVAVMVMLVNLGVRGDSVYRYPLNSLMFFFISLGSAEVFYAVGGNHQPDFLHIQEFIPITLYHLTAFCLNQILLSSITFFIHKDRKVFGKSDFMWDALASTTVVYPIGLAMYMLYVELGIITIFLVGIPYICVAAMFKLYNSTRKMNRALQKTSDIGHQISGILNMEKVLDIFLEKITDLLPIDAAYVYEKKNEELSLICKLENEQHDFGNVTPIAPYKGIAEKVYASGRQLIIHSPAEFPSRNASYIPQYIQSVMSVPIMRNSQTEGVIILAAVQKKAFEKYQLTLVDILCSHLIAAVENARLHEETKKNSEVCALTKVYNYRYFEELLHSQYEKVLNGGLQELSLILLDLDHFKAVNDTYGHQGGNDILYQMATRLKEIIGAKGTVARYGGEEFVVLLPDCGKEGAYSLAEKIRSYIETRPFILHSDLGERRTKLEVFITASIGVASAADAEDPLSLVRHADRAMYMGAKKAGRNRVAQYSN